MCSMPCNPFAGLRSFLKGASGCGKAPGRKYAQVLEAARQEMFSNGFERTSMDAIALRAGVSKATVYSYFSSKDEIFQSVLVNEANIFHGGLRVMVDDADTSPLIKFAQIGQHVMSMKLSGHASSLFRILIAQSSRVPEFGRFINEELRGQIRSVIVTVFQRAKDQGILDFDDVSEPLHFFCWLLNADYFMSMLIEPNAVPPDAAVVTRHVDWVIARLLDCYGTAAYKNRSSREMPIHSVE